MLGVRRTSVSLVAGELQRAGLNQIPAWQHPPGGPRRNPRGRVRVLREGAAALRASVHDLDIVMETVSGLGDARILRLTVLGARERLRVIRNGHADYARLLS
jgi:hypothetical protein